MSFGSVAFDFIDQKWSPGEAFPPSHARARSRTLIVDDHEIAREGLRSALDRDPDIEVVAVAGDAASALVEARSTRPDIAIVDLHLPGTAGDELCRELKAAHPKLAVIILSSYLNEDAVRRSFAAGGIAYVTKAAGLAELRATLRQVRTSGPLPSATRSVSQTIRRLDDLVAARTADELPTAHQLRVLESVASGMTYQEIADHLFISRSTVKYHVQNLKVKLGVSSRTQLVVTAIEFGLIGRPEDEQVGAVAS